MCGCFFSETQCTRSHTQVKCWHVELDMYVCIGGYWASSGPMWRPSWRGGQQWGGGAGHR